MYKKTLTGRPHDTSVQKATSDNENVDAVLRHAQDTVEIEHRDMLKTICNKQVIKQTILEKRRVTTIRTANRMV